MATTETAQHAYVPGSAHSVGDGVATALCSCGFETRSGRAFQGEDVPSKAIRNIRTHAAYHNRKAKTIAEANAGTNVQAQAQNA